MITPTSSMVTRPLGIIADQTSASAAIRGVESITATMTGESVDILLPCFAKSLLAASSVPRMTQGFMAYSDFLLDRGMIFTNLVDFDTLYGHRNDVPGYARNLEAVDEGLGEVLAAMREDDVFMLTADHGCDPGDVSTDHTREHVPLLVRGARVRPATDLGVRTSFADLGATLAENFGLARLEAGRSFLAEL